MNLRRWHMKVTTGKIILNLFLEGFNDLSLGRDYTLLACSMKKNGCYFVNSTEWVI